MTDFVRVERDGKVAYVSEKRELLKLPTEETCREKLIKLLEETKGDAQHPKLKKWWLDRAKECTNPTPMRAAWACEVFELLSKTWDELVGNRVPVPVEKPEEIDVFADFGL